MKNPKVRTCQTIAKVEIRSKKVWLELENRMNLAFQGKDYALVFVK